MAKAKIQTTTSNPSGPMNLDVRPLTPQLMEALGETLRGSWGSSCWCMHPRMTDAQMRALPGEGPPGKRRRAAMTELAARPRAPGLLAFAGDEPVGWVAIAPRTELGRVTRSRATPPVDDQDAWVIPCLTVRQSARGKGVAVSLIQAAVRFAAEHGATVVESYPRAGTERTGDDNAYFGTEPLFRKAGFKIVRQPLENRPKNWLPRLAMRIDAQCGIAEITGTP